MTRSGFLNRTLVVLFLCSFQVGSLPAALAFAAPGRAGATSPPMLLVQLSQEERAIPPAMLSPEQAAVVLMEVAGRFEDRGEIAAARLLYREVIDRYGDTIQASRARERLTALEGRPDSGSGSGATGTGGVGDGGSTEVTPPPVTPPAEPRYSSRAPRRTSGLDQSGRVSVIVYSTALAAWVALAIPIYAEAEGSPAYGLALLLGAPAGLVTSIYATKDRQVTAPQADIFVLAGNLGLWHGLAIGLIEDWDGHAVAGATAIGGLAGAVTGALLVAPGRTRETSASLSSLAAPCGIWYGLVLSEMFRDNGDGGGDSGDSRIGAMLLGGDVALIGSVLTMRQVSLSRERARLIGLAGAAGGLFGGAIDLIFRIDGKEAWGMVGAGTTGGLAAGVALTSEYDAKRRFDDPPRGAREETGPDLAVLPLHVRASKAAGPDTERWRESLRVMGLTQTPSVGLTLLEARFR